MNQSVTFNYKATMQHLPDLGEKTENRRGEKRSRKWWI